MAKKDVDIYDHSRSESSYNVEECVCSFPFDLMVWHEFLDYATHMFFERGSHLHIYLLLRWLLFIIFLL